MIAFRLVGIALIAVLIGWVTWGLVTQSFWRAPPAIADFASAFEGSANLPKEEIEKRIADAKSRMNTINQRGRLLKLIGEITGWVSFACTAAITLVLGYFGRTSSPRGQATDVGGLPARTARIVGVLAALAAVLTAAGTMAENAGQTRYDRADQAAQIIREAQRTIGDSTAEREARDALDEMQRKVDQL